MAKPELRGKLDILQEGYRMVANLISNRRADCHQAGFLRVSGAEHTERVLAATPTV